MTKIEELMNSVIVDGPVYPEQYFSIENIEKIMKEYAEFYAKKCLEIAVENAFYVPDRYGTLSKKYVNKDDVLNINLPEHD